MSGAVRWGILSTADIAIRKVIPGIRQAARCEVGAIASRDGELARATAERLGINYPLLLSSTEDPCPLQEALHVQAYPTMILVDRQGQILWRDQGSTPITLARLDRVIAASIAETPEVVRR